MFAYMKKKESLVNDSRLLFLALARLADWEGIPVGVVEVDTPETQKFTIVLHIPENSIGCVIPRNEMYGRWKNMPLPDDVAFFNTPEYEKRLKRLIQASLIRTLRTMDI